jgi:hypothetical protein
VSEISGNGFAAFSDPRKVWGNGIELAIEEAFRLHFKTRIIGERIMNIRMPFAQNNERDVLLDAPLTVAGGGKSSAAVLWPSIESMLDSGDFAAYAAALCDGREKVIIFDLSQCSWEISDDFVLIARMKAGLYPGLPHRPYVLVSGSTVSESDVYNYLYCVGRIGVDCSGFVWNTLVYAASRGGLDLARVVGPSITGGKYSAADLAWYAGTSLYNSSNPNIISVDDKIANLRPADIILFRGPDGNMTHSAIIQSVDFEKGIIRYLQSTDIALQDERGVHESFVHFDPRHPGISLRDSSLVWLNKRQPAFLGEVQETYPDDGKRYRAYPEFGGGRVVRLRAMSQLRF